jgi:SAM-dependent methyltransferase
MPDRAERAYLKPYRDAVDRFGPGFEATLWNSREAQLLRFDVMADLAGLDGRSVLDVGCGPGDFAARLLERGIAFTDYTGIDAVPEMIGQAERRGLARCRFRVADAVADPAALAAERADYVCVSGTLNTMEETTARRLVVDAFAAAGRGVVFNFLSSRAGGQWSARDPAPARRFDPVGWVAAALALSPRVAFTQAYLDGHDATILIEHPAGPGRV